MSDHMTPEEMLTPKPAPTDDEWTGFRPDINMPNTVVPEWAAEDFFIPLVVDAPWE